MSVKLKRLGTSRYATHDERFLVEHTAVSTGEWDDDDMGWCVWDAQVTPNLADVGIPEAVYEGAERGVMSRYVVMLTDNDQGYQDVEILGSFAAARLPRPSQRRHRRSSTASMPKRPAACTSSAPSFPASTPP